MLPDLDPLLHAQLRLQIMTLLMQVEWAEFNYLLEQTGASKGNLSTQLNKLKTAGYLKIEKSFGQSYPVTRCKIEPKGREAFENYVTALKSYFPQ